MKRCRKAIRPSASFFAFCSPELAETSNASKPAMPIAAINCRTQTVFDFSTLYRGWGLERVDLRYSRTRSGGRAVNHTPSLRSPGVSPVPLILPESPASAPNN